jgi:hypothetical protein
MKRSSFVVDSEGLVNDARFVLKDPLYVFDILPLDVPEQVLVPGVAVSDALNSSSDTHYKQFECLNSFHQT